jgi:hypothetical protein
MNECTKASFPTLAEADRVLPLIQAKNLAAGKKLPARSYQCEWCREFHHTSKVRGSARFPRR